MPFGTSRAQGFNNPVTQFFEAGNTVIMNRAGVFIYDGKPAFGNLIETLGIITQNTDRYGNLYFTGDTTYASTGGTGRIAKQENGNKTQVFTAASAAGPYTLIGDITWTPTGDLFIEGGGATGGITLSPIGGSHMVTVQGDMTVGDIFSNSGGFAALGLVNGWANGAGNVTAQYKFVPVPAQNVELIGSISSAAATNVKFGQLPLGMRPVSQQGFAAGASGNVAAGMAPFVQCDTSGNLTIQGTAALPGNGNFRFHGTISLTA